MVYREECLRILKRAVWDLVNKRFCCVHGFQGLCEHDAKLLCAYMQPEQRKSVTRGLKVGLVIANGLHGSPPQMRRTSGCSLCKPSECDDSDEQVKMSIAPTTSPSSASSGVTLHYPALEQYETGPAQS